MSKNLAGSHSQNGNNHRGTHKMKHPITFPQKHTNFVTYVDNYTHFDTMKNILYFENDNFENTSFKILNTLVLLYIYSVLPILKK